MKSKILIISAIFGIIGLLTIIVMLIISTFTSMPIFNYITIPAIIITGLNIEIIWIATHFQKSNFKRKISDHLIWTFVIMGFACFTVFNFTQPIGDAKIILFIASCLSLIIATILGIVQNKQKKREETEKNE